MKATVEEKNNTVQIGHGIRRRETPPHLSSRESRALLRSASGKDVSSYDIRWGPFVDAAKYHRLAPLLPESMYRDSMPDEATAKLRDFNRRSEERIARAHRGLAAILSEAERRELPLAVFKGPALSQQLYAKREQRTYYDLDLAVSREALEAAERLMVDLDYEMPRLKSSDLLWMVGRRPSDNGERRLSAEETRSLWLANHFHVPFVPRDQSAGVRVDLHWSLFQPQRLNLPLKDLLERAQPIEIEGNRALTFASADNLIYLCLHAALEGYDRVRLIKHLDILKAGEKLTKDEWDGTVELVQRYRIEEPFYVGLSVSYAVFGRSLPSTTQRVAPSGLKRWLLKRLVSPQALVHCSAPSSQAIWEWSAGEPLIPTAGRWANALARKWAKKILRKSSQ